MARSSITLASGGAQLRVIDRAYVKHYHERDCSRLLHGVGPKTLIEHSARPQQAIALCFRYLVWRRAIIINTSKIGSSAGMHPGFLRVRKRPYASSSPSPWTVQHSLQVRKTIAIVRRQRHGGVLLVNATYVRKCHGCRKTEACSHELALMMR